MNHYPFASHKGFLSLFSGFCSCAPLLGVRDTLTFFFSPGYTAAEPESRERRSVLALIVTSFPTSDVDSLE